MIIIRSSKLQFRNPSIGQPTRAIKEHYAGRLILCDVNGQERMFRFKNDELAFEASEEEMIEAIEQKLIEEAK